MQAAAWRPAGLRLVEAYSLMWDYYRDGTRTVTWFDCEPEPLM